MCKLKSGIILKDDVFVPDYDGHTEMLEELKIADTRENAERLFVRAELYPEDGDIFSDVDSWTFNVDQDITPDWFVADYEKTRMVAAVKEWAKNHIFVDIEDLSISISGSESATLYLKDCKNANIDTRGSSTAIAQESNLTRDCFILMENSTLKDCRTKTIYQSGDWTLVAVAPKEGKLNE